MAICAPFGSCRMMFCRTLNGLSSLAVTDVPAPPEHVTTSTIARRKPYAGISTSGRVTIPAAICVLMSYPADSRCSTDARTKGTGAACLPPRPCS